MPSRRPSLERTPELLELRAAGASRQPLAARMRPRTLDEFVGQEHLVGERGALRRSIERGHLASILLWGPPGSGKTTLARLLADAVGARFVTLSAVMSGVAEVRRLIAEAREWLDRGGSPTVLFIDEIHRFNKAQQDALLPQVEDGTITLIGATTENPYYEVNSALLSRLRVFRLEPLTDEQLTGVVQRALADERGLGGAAALGSDALEHLAQISSGDARAALNVLEAAVAMTQATGGDRDGGGGEAGGPIRPTLESIESAAQERVLAYDRAGDGHYDTVSAFIKSIRGNDPDAALYWLATMVAAGEDPRFIARRLIISASEDVGNADPRGLQVAVAAAQALDWVGLPEAQFALAQATAYLASAPKSNRAGTAYWSAMTDVQERGSLPVPLHLRSGTYREKKAHGIGVGYRNPHDHPGADIEQQYLPEALAGRRYYQPTDQGMELQIATRLERLGDARAAARDPSTSREERRPPDERSPAAGSKVDAMRVAGGVMRQREESRKRIAERERREAEAD
ncbi:MAG: replication-associated recombination protein A [Chloroflexi bacterium]|nr:replication-associated recombination protein A [Chloroflexota bacterium]